MSPRNHFIFTPMLPSTAVGKPPVPRQYAKQRGPQPGLHRCAAAAARHSRGGQHLLELTLFPCVLRFPGTVEFRSLLEPIRNSNPYVTYFEANCDSIDPDKKVGDSRA